MILEQLSIWRASRNDELCQRRNHSML